MKLPNHCRDDLDPFRNYGADLNPKPVLKFRDNGDPPVVAGDRQLRGAPSPEGIEVSPGPRVP